jgi:pyridoxal phosphate enzyme (YggS family)
MSLSNFPIEKVSPVICLGDICTEERGNKEILRESAWVVGSAYNKAVHSGDFHYHPEHGQLALSKSLHLIMSDIGDNYLQIANRVRELNPSAQLVSVSKTKPIDDLKAAFAAGCRVFGENYVDELVDKAPLIPEAEFHLIGHLQSNKVAKLCRVPNLALIHTIDSENLAAKVNKAWPADRPPLSILIQVNTSDEPQKNGIGHSNTSLLALILFIKDKCPQLVFRGLMTVGELGEGRRDFERLIEVRNRLAGELKIDPKDIELSMGMSADYELALELGATYVRVGSSIFGARQYRT